MATSHGYYLLKSEPSEFSIQQLQRENRQEWDGVRSFAARKHLLAMKPGDRCFFYHSSCKTPSIVGTCRIARKAQPDATAVDPSHPNHDEKSTSENNRWVSVLVEFEALFQTPISIQELRTQAIANPIIANLMLLRHSRLSVMPLSDEQWQAILDLQARKERGENLLYIDDNNTTAQKKNDSQGRVTTAKDKSGKTKQTKTVANGFQTKESAIAPGLTLEVDDPSYCSHPAHALSQSCIQAIKDGTATKITEKELGLNGRRHLYKVNDRQKSAIVIFYDGAKFIGKDLARMNTMVEAAKQKAEEDKDVARVYLLLSTTAGICKRKSLPELLSKGVILQREPI